MRLFNLKSVVALLCCSLAFFAFTSLPVCHAQDTSGMTGTVTDQSGAAIPGATVVLTNTATGTKYTQTTNSIGTYRFTQIPPGVGYSARITAKGFAPVSVSNITLLVGQVRTQNASMSVGTQVSTVEVTASNAVVTLDTSDAIVGNDLDPEQLNNLPVQQRNNPTALFTMQPGVTVSGSVTGARVDQNYVTVDGLDVNDFATGGAVQSNTGPGVSSGFDSSFVGNAPVDSVEQFHAGVAGNEADIGSASGGQFQLVTKSGTNRFHGGVYEYHRDTSLVANSWFSNNSTPIIPRNHLIQNQFGGNFGGPALRNKVFFFFDFNDSRVISSAIVTRAVPLDSLRNGNINYYNASGGVETLTPAQIKSFDPAGIGESTSWISYFNKRFPHPNNSNAGDGLNSGGFSFNAPNNDLETNYVGRGDFHITPNMNLWGVLHINRENAVNAPNEFPGDPVTAPVSDRSYSFVLHHDWAIGSTKTNQVYLGETVQKLSFPDNYNPQGSTAFTFSDGADQSLTSNLYLWPDSQARRVPIPVLGDDFSWVKGRHTLQWGGTFKDILAHNTNITDFNLAEIGLGGQIFGLCGPITPDDPTACGSTDGVPNPSLRPSDIGADNALLYDEALAYMLGRIGNVQSTYNYDAKGSVLKQLTGDQRFYRYYQTQLYFQDSWKVVPGFTLSYGLTYQYFSVPYETRGLESVEPLSFNQYFQARVAAADLGEAGAAAVPLLAYYLGGKGNGSGAPPMYQPEYRNLAPHLGFAWNPGFDKKLVINGGGSIVYDRTVIFAVQTIQDSYSYLFQQNKVTQNGIPDDPYNSIRLDPRLDSQSGLSTMNLTPPATPKPPYQPFVDPATCEAEGFAYAPCGLQNGYDFNSTIDPALKTPYSFLFNFGVQRQMPWDMVLKATYVSRLGRRLLGQPDANQVLDFVDPQSGQLLSAAFGSITTQARQGIKPAAMQVQPWFENVVQPGLGQDLGYGSNTEFLAAAVGGLVRNGDFGDFVQAISSITPANVGSAAQFSENNFYSNDGFSSYNGLLLTLTKNPSHGLSYDFNYTWSHSIDNTSFFANSMGDTGIGGIGLICDVIRPRECRSRSDFDMTHLITADATYGLPFGKGRMFAASAPNWTNEIIGNWDLSGIGSFHTGTPWSATSNAFVASYSNDAPPIFIGSNRSVIKNHVNKHPAHFSGGGVTDFADSLTASQSLQGPVGFQIGPRNSYQGPDYFNTDLGLAKTFPIYKEAVNLKFRADAFNAFNHPNFQNPAENVYNGLDQQDYQRKSKFGQISFTETPSGNLNNGARVLQLSLRLEF
jgi:hypothetical protein